MEFEIIERINWTYFGLISLPDGIYPECEEKNKINQNY